MASSLFQARHLLASLQRCSRGYAAWSSRAPPVGRSGMRRSGDGFEGKQLQELERFGVDQNSGASSAWVPDPVTGYYRPINHTVEIDPVELREMLLSNNHKATSH